MCANHIALRSLLTPGLGQDVDVCLLWTGGWDSSFRLLSLVLEHGARVQPFYVVLLLENSLFEMRAMAAVRKVVTSLSPAAAVAIRPSILISHADIDPEPSITALYQELRQKAFLGPQYDWLARCVQQFGIPNLELSVHRDDKAYTFLQGEVERVSERFGDYWRLNPHPSRPELRLFERFRFPILELTKLEMQEHARRAGFLEPLNQTWFCHRPCRGKPCGLCNPCKYTYEEGMGWRIPISGRVRRRLSPLYSMAGAGRQLARRARRLCFRGLRAVSRKLESGA